MLTIRYDYIDYFNDKFVPMSHVGYLSDVS